MALTLLTHLDFIIFRRLREFGRVLVGLLGHPELLEGFGSMGHNPYNMSCCSTERACIRPFNIMISKSQTGKLEFWQQKRQETRGKEDDLRRVRHSAQAMFSSTESASRTSPSSSAVVSATHRRGTKIAWTWCEMSGQMASITRVLRLVQSWERIRCEPETMVSSSSMQTQVAARQCQYSKLKDELGGAGKLVHYSNYHVCFSSFPPLLAVPTS